MSGAEDLRARLRRLRRDGPSDPPPAEAEAPRAPAVPGRAIDPPAELREGSNARGTFAFRLRHHPGVHRHGDWALEEVDGVLDGELAHVAKDPALDAVDPRAAVYLDLETNGLAGGAGTIPFLVALGTFESDGRFALWQGFLREPAEEAALLEEAARRIAAAGAVVSFFGKSFDRHRLEDKMRLHGVEPPFEGRAHLDLYHPCRRLYRDALDDGRLQTMERALCAVERDDDLPGAFAPEAWMDFLAGRAHRLEKVFQHNADDVLSLVTLLAHLGRTSAEARRDGGSLAGDSGVRALGLARLACDAKDRERELAWLTRATERGRAGRELDWTRSLALRALGRTAESAELWRAIALGAADELAARAWVELAKFAEHSEKNPRAAREACDLARRAVENSVTGPRRRRWLAELETRRARLERSEAN